MVAAATVALGGLLLVMLLLLVRGGNGWQQQWYVCLRGCADRALSSGNGEAGGGFLLPLFA